MKTWQQILKIETSSEPLRSMTLPELKAEQDKVVTGLKVLLDAVDSEKRDINSTEEGAFKGAEKYLDEIKAEHGKRPANQPPSLTGVYRAGGGEVPPIPQYGVVGASYGRLFHGRDDYEPEPVDVEKFCQHVLMNTFDSRTMTEGTGSEGGFAVPAYWHNSIYQSTKERSFALSKCRMFNMESNILHVPCWDSESRPDGFFGGVQVQNLSEAETATPVTPKLRLASLKVKKFGLYINLSREVIEDSNSISASIGPMMEGALAELIDEKILIGTGVGEPRGIINCPSAITIGRATASTVTFADLVSLRSRIFPAFAKSGIWIISPDVLEQLLQIEDTGGSLVFVPPLQGISGNVPMKLLGNDLYISDKIGPLGSKDVIFADLSQVALGWRGGIMLQRSDAPYFTSDLITLRALVRFDSLALIDSEISPRNGSATSLSWCAILE